MKLIRFFFVSLYIVCIRSGPGLFSLLHTFVVLYNSLYFVCANCECVIVQLQQRLTRAHK